MSRSHTLPREGQRISRTVNPMLAYITYITMKTFVKYLMPNVMNLSECRVCFSPFLFLSRRLENLLNLFPSSSF